MKLTIATTFAALALAGAAIAQPAPGRPGGGPAPTPEMQAARQAMREACMADLKANCADKQGREAMQCVMQNQDKLSQGCKDAMVKMRAARQAAGGPGGR